jgi:hypothetical protein
MVFEYRYVLFILEIHVDDVGRYHLIGTVPAFNKFLLQGRERWHAVLLNILVKV